ncbi:MAG: pilus assembly protein PilM [Candidatus Aureabacteria bacterium]|nr:pilus assembly protein PilM [Candidatus Auribacterota bacterium]
MIGTKKNFISLDIGHSGIKAALLNSVKKNIVLSQLIYEPYPIEESDNITIDYINQQVISFIDKYEIQGYVVFTLSDPSLSVQNIKLPSMPYDEIPEAVKWELSRSLKLDPKETLYDFIINKNSPDGDTEGIPVLSGICSREPFERIARTLKRKKLKILGCDLSMLCDFRLFEQCGYFKPEETYLLINFGALFTNLSVVNKNELIFNRRVSLNGLMLTRAIKEYCKVDFNTAEELKTKYGLATDELSDKIIESINIVNSNCEKMVSDIQYSLKYFSYQVSRSNITTFDKVFITGGASNLNGFSDFLKERLHADVVHVSFDNKISAIRNQIEDSENGATWISLVSTVVGGLFWDKKKVNKTCVNLLPGELTEGGKKEFVSIKTVAKRLFSTFGAFLVLFGFIIGLFLIYSHQNKNIKDLNNLYKLENKRKKQVEKNNEDLLKTKAKMHQENELLENKIDIVKKKIHEFTAIGTNSINPSYYIAEIVNNTPYPDVVLNIISFEGNKLIIRGDAVNNSVVSTFMKNLNDSKYFYNTHFDFMEKITHEKTLYPINFKLNTTIKAQVTNEN